jgi:hypothetical protein
MPSWRIFQTSRHSRCAIAQIAPLYPSRGISLLNTFWKWQPFFWTAACAAWLRTRLRNRFLFGDRELWLISALASLPGMVPNQEANCAESTPSPGVSASRITASSCFFSAWATI